MGFLYFPEDKTEYIVAFFTFLPFILGTIFTFWWFKRLSKKEQEFLEKSPEQYISKKLYSQTNVNEKRDNQI
jgi:hypothetical protein